MSSIFHFAVRLALLCSKIVLSGYLEVQDGVRYMTLRVGNSGELEVSRLANNPFLILGVSATAEMGVIQKVGKEVAMRAKLGGGDEAKVHRVESAIEQLKDPVKRFRWGVLWLQMSDDDSAKYRADPVLSSFAMDATQDAATAFEKLIHDQPPELANHNIGLLSLIQAEAATEKAQGDTPDDVEDDIECVPLWERAFKHLAESFASEKFWMRQRMFAKTLADPRLTTDVVTRVQEDTARLVLRLPSKVIQTALLRQHAGVASAFVGVINESGFNKDTVESLLSEIYKPLADRVEHNVEKLSGRLQSQSGKSRSPYEKILADFKREVLPDLRVMLKVGDLPGYAEEHARDTSAEFLRSFGIKAWNECEAHTLSERALEYAIEVADSDALQQKLSDDAKQIAELGVMKPINDAMKRADREMERDHWEEAISILQDARSGVSASARRQLDDFIHKVKGAYATKLFNEAMKLVNLGMVDAALEKLNRAMVYETVMSDRAVIQDAIDKVSSATRRAASSGSSGCVLVLAIPVILAILAMGWRIFSGSA